MTPDESLRVCRLAKALSPAQAVDEYMPEAWHLVLRHWRCEDAMTALEQLGGEQEWLHVSHVVARIKRIRRDRVLEFGTLPNPPASVDPDGPGYRKWLAETTEAIADGNYQPPAPEAITGRHDVIRELGQAGTSVDAELATKPLREALQRARHDLQAARAEEKRAKDEKRAATQAAREADRTARAAAPQPEAGRRGDEQGEVA